MAGKTSATHYQRLVAACATSAFALLGMLAAEQHEANVVTASTVRNATVMTHYRASENCLVRVNKKMRTVTSNYRFCRSK